MAVLAGYNGSVNWGTVLGTTGYDVHAWKLDLTAEPPDKTNFTSTGWKSFLAGLRQWGGSLEMFIDGSNQLTIADIGSSATIQLFFNDTYLLQGNAICTGVHPSVSVEGIQTQTVDFQGTGAASRIAGALTMTINSTTTVDPVFTATTLADADFTWRSPNEIIFTGKAPAGANFVTGGVGKYIVTCTDWSAVTEFDADTDNVTAVDVAVATALTTLSLGGNAMVTPPDLTYNTELTTLFLATNTGMTTPPILTYNTALTTLSINNCTSMTTVDIGDNPLLSLVEVYGCALTIVAVSTILTDLAAAAVNGGIVDLSLQLPTGAIPNAAGQTAILTLEGVPRGPWTVTVDEAA